jgi:hypothetical protein
MGRNAKEFSRYGNHKPGVAHRSRKDRPSAGLDCARPRRSFLALLANVETAAGLDDPDYIDEGPSDESD